MENGARSLLRLSSTVDPLLPTTGDHRRGTEVCKTTATVNNEKQKLRQMLDDSRVISDDNI